ncbi:hypothetical protein AB7Z49_01495 [Providencia rettgeri]
MKKLLIAAALATTTLLFGCSDEKQKTIDSVVSHLEAREDMFPYQLEFKDLNFIGVSKKEPNNGWLCGEIKISQKTSVKPNELPNIFFSKMDEEIGSVINSNDYFKFIYMTNSNIEGESEGLAIKIVYPYDKEGLNEWKIVCSK